MNSLQDLIKRLSNIGQVTEAKEKCPECGKVHEGECDKEILLDKDKVDESKKKKPDADKDGIPDWADKDEEKVDESVAQGYDSVESNYGEWEGILEKDGYRDPDVSGARALDLVVGHQQGPDAFVSAIRSILTYVKQNSEVLGKAVADRKTVKDCIMDIKNEYPQYYQAAQQQGMAEGAAWDKLKAFGKDALNTADRIVTGGDKEDLLKDLKDKAGVRNPENGKPSMAISDVEKQKQVKETALNLLRRYAGIQETKIEEDDVEEGNDFSFRVQKLKAQGAKSGTKFKTSDGQEHILECGDDYEMSGQMSPMTMTGQEQPHMGIPAEVMAQMAAPEQGPEMAQPEMAEPEEPKAKYTLNISNGDNNLSMTTDMPDEIIHIMKLAGVNKGAEVTKKSAPEGEQEVEESGYENTPDNTRARDPQAFGDIRDWGQKGTGAGKPNYPGTKASGDNPMSEQRMFEDYKNFKAGK
jgi:hypothetical protein